MSSKKYTIEELEELSAEWWIALDDEHEGSYVATERALLGWGSDAFLEWLKERSEADSGDELETLLEKYLAQFDKEGPRVGRFVNEYVAAKHETAKFLEWLKRSGVDSGEEFG